VNSTTIRHLHESVALLPMGDLGPVNEFYRRLFELAPEVRPLFKRDMELQAKKFSETLAWIMAYLEHPHELRQEPRELGAPQRLWREGRPVRASRFGADLDVPTRPRRPFHAGDGRSMAGGLRLHQLRNRARCPRSGLNWHLSPSPQVGPTKHQQL